MTTDLLREIEDVMSVDVYYIFQDEQRRAIPEILISAIAGALVAEYLRGLYGDSIQKLGRQTIELLSRMRDRVLGRRPEAETLADCQALLVIIELRVGPEYKSISSEEFQSLAIAAKEQVQQFLMEISFRPARAADLASQVNEIIGRRLRG